LLIFIQLAQPALLVFAVFMRIDILKIVFFIAAIICTVSCAQKESAKHSIEQPKQISVKPSSTQPFGSSPKQRTFLSREIGLKRAAFYNVALWAMGENQLSIFANKDNATVRLLLYPWRHHPCAVRVEKRGKDISVVTKWLKRKGKIKNAELIINEHRAATLKQFIKLKHLLALASFRTIRSKSSDKKLYYRKEERMLLEGVFGEIFHAVEIRIPLEDIPIKRIKEYLLEISGNWKANQRLLEQFRK